MLVDLPSSDGGSRVASPASAGGGQWELLRRAGFRELPVGVLSSLKVRSNWPALLYLISWSGFVVLAMAAHSVVASPFLSVPLYLLASAAMVIGATAFSHECSHATAFRSRSLNEMTYFVTSLLYMEEPHLRRMKHGLHHAYTSFADSDPEIDRSAPATLTVYVGELFGIQKMFGRIVELARGAAGRSKLLNAHGREIRPISAAQVATIRKNSIVFLVCYGGLATWGVVGETMDPVVYFFVPRLLGEIAMQFMTIPFHAEMSRNSANVLETTRSVRCSTILSYLICNMNRHVEHHLFPSVPFYALPALSANLGEGSRLESHSAFRSNLEVVKSILSRRQSLR